MRDANERMSFAGEARKNLPQWFGVPEAAEDDVTVYCRAAGDPFMTVKTLSEKQPDPDYQKTRQLHVSCGFRPFEEFPNLPGRANPCLYMLKPIE